MEKIEENFTLDEGRLGADRKKVEPSDLGVSLDLQVPKSSVRSTRLRIKLKWLEVRFMHVKFCLLNCYFSFVQSCPVEELFIHLQEYDKKILGN